MQENPRVKRMRNEYINFEGKQENPLDFGEN